MVHVPHPHVPHPHARVAATDTWQDKLADWVSAAFGNMNMFWVLVAWQLGWMAMASVGVWLFASDKYPFPFLLFCSNLIQLWALPVLGVATNRADKKRAAKADADHEALTHLAHQQEVLLAEVRGLGSDQGE